MSLGEQILSGHAGRALVADPGQGDGSLYGKVHREAVFPMSPMTPKKGEQLKEEKFLVYSKSTRAVEEVFGKKLITDIFLEAGMWFGALERNHKIGELPERMELIFRIMNAKGENFFGPGSGIKRIREPEILSNAGRREMRQRMKLFFEANVG